MSVRQAVANRMPTLREIKPALNALKGGLRKLKFRMSRPNLYDRSTRERLGVIYSAPTHLPIADRLVLYAIVRGRRPRRVLEIGSARGGSASIITSAMEDNGLGLIVGLDPAPTINVKAPEYYGRLRLLMERAPDGIKAASNLAGGGFDLVFYDGPNVYSEVKRAIEGLIPYLAERSMIIFDNGLHYGVRQAVTEAIAAEQRMHDCGYLSVNADVVTDPCVAYLGLLLVRFETGASSDPQPWIDLACTAEGKAPKRFDAACLNHDVWWCRTMQPCEKCARDRDLVSCL